jgi:hypothetical protein
MKAKLEQEWRVYYIKHQIACAKKAGIEVIIKCPTKMN